MADEEETRKRVAENGAEANGAEKKRKVVEDSDSDDDVVPAVAKLLQDSDSDSDSSSSSSASTKVSRKKKPKSRKSNEGGDVKEEPGQAKTELAQEGDPDDVPLQALVPAPASPASSDSSSSSSSSDSGDESDLDSRPPPEPSQSEMDAKPPEPQLSQIEIARRASLRREDMAQLLATLPFEVAEEAVVRSFVRLAVDSNPAVSSAAAASDTVCVLAEVSGLEPSDVYKVTRTEGHPLMLRARLKVKRGTSQRYVRVASVSNGEITENELEQWKRLTAKTGVDPDALIESAIGKAAEINSARNFKYTDSAVSMMLKRKGADLEFDAQKESRMRFLVQCTQSQMDISNLRDNEAHDLEQRYKDSVHQLQIQEARSTDMQNKWFEKRPSLFSLKMINKKNYERQVADDKHALQYTLATETGEAGGTNPFQRRACRPIVAWDTVLTKVEGLPLKEQKKPEAATDAAKAAGADAAEKRAAEAADASAAEAAGPDLTPDERMRNVVRGSLGALPLLRKMGLNM